MAEAVFWRGYFGIEWPLEDWVPRQELDRAVTELTLQSLGHLISGLHRGLGGAAFTEWFARHRTTLASRFRKEMSTPILEDDGTKLTVHFIVPADDSERPREGGPRSGSGNSTVAGIGPEPATTVARPSGTDLLHDLTIERLELLARLFPDRDLFASQGYGQRVWAHPVAYDSTYKAGIARRSFQPRWLVNVNGTFLALGDLYFRPPTWQEYVDNVLELRNTVLRLLAQLEAGLAAYLKKRVIRPNEPFYLVGGNAAAYTQEHDWHLCTARLNQPPSLPACLMDEWGITREGAAPDTRPGAVDHGGVGASARAAGTDNTTSPGQYLAPYRPFIKATNDYFNALYRFFSQAWAAAVLNPVLGKRAGTRADKDTVLKRAEDPGIDQRQTPLSVFNFAGAIEVLGVFQDEFRLKLGAFCNAQDLGELERKERLVLRRVWAMWYFFALEPNSVFTDPLQECQQQVISKLNRIRGRLEARLSAISSRTLTISLTRNPVTWDGAPVLAIVLDGEDALEAFQVRDQVVQTIQDTIPFPGRDELENYALQFAWPNVALVPLVRGRSASGSAWHVNRRVLTANSSPTQLGWYNWILKPMPADTLQSLGITAWSEFDFSNAYESVRRDKHAYRARAAYRRRRKDGRRRRRYYRGRRTREVHDPSNRQDSLSCRNDCRKWLLN